MRYCLQERCSALEDQVLNYKIRNDKVLMAGTTYSAQFSLPITTLEIAAVDVEQIVKTTALLEAMFDGKRQIDLHCLRIAYKFTTT